MMKQITFFLALILAIPLWAQLPEIPRQEIPEAYGYIVKPGQQIPDIELTLTDGTVVTAAGLKGKVVMLQFTASWCGVCRREMPHIENEIWQKHKDKEDFLLIGVDLEEPLETVKEFARDMKITYPMATDPGGKVFYSFAARGAGVTRNVIIDRNGKIVYMTRLFKTKEFEEMKTVIDLLLRRT